MQEGQLCGTEQLEAFWQEEAQTAAPRRVERRHALVIHDDVCGCEPTLMQPVEVNVASSRLVDEGVHQ